MKTRLTRSLSLILAAILLLPPLSGCGKKGATLDDLQPTDELVIYLPQKAGIDASERVMTSEYVTPFRDLYGEDVRVRLVVVPGGIEEYEERVVNEVMGGGGPDVLFLSFLPHMDVEKAARNHSFYDLTDLLASDPDFREEDYVDGVMDAVKLGGRQYTVPLTYIPPVYLADRNRLNALDFSWDRIGKTSDFLEELTRMSKETAGDEDTLQVLQSRNCFRELLSFSGIRLLDYENQTVLPDEAAFRDFMECYKPFFPYDYSETEEFDHWRSRSRAVAQGSIVFFPEVEAQRPGGSILTIQAAPGGAYAMGVLPGQNGQRTAQVGTQLAVSGGSKNVRNAYNFIRMMLSEELQGLTLHGFNLGSPVNRKTIEDAVYGHGRFRDSCAFLPEEEQDAIVRHYTEMERFIWPVAATALDLTWESMLPWMQDEKSYEDCLAELKSKLTFYMSE